MTCSWSSGKLSPAAFPSVAPVAAGRAVEGAGGIELVGAGEQRLGFAAFAAEALDVTAGEDAGVDGVAQVPHADAEQRGDLMRGLAHPMHLDRRDEPADEGGVDRDVVRPPVRGGVAIVHDGVHGRQPGVVGTQGDAPVARRGLEQRMATPLKPRGEFHRVGGELGPVGLEGFEDVIGEGLHGGQVAGGGWQSG